MLKGLFAVFSAKIGGYMKGLSAIVSGTQGAANSVNKAAGDMRESLTSAFSGDLRSNITNISEQISLTKEAIVNAKQELVQLQAQLKKQKEGTKEFRETQKAIKITQQNLKELNIELSEFNIKARDQKKALADSRLAAEDNSAAMEATSRAVSAASSALLLLGDSGAAFRPIIQGLSAAMAGVNAVIAIQNLKLRENQVFANLTAKAQNGLRAAFIGTNTAATAFKSILSSIGIGLAIAGITAFISKMMEVSKATSEAEESQKKFNESYSKIGGSELTKVNLLISQVNDLSLALDTRKSALKKLQDIFPAYFKNLDDEKILSGQVRIETEKLTSAILANAKAKALQQRVEENAVKLLSKQEELTGAQNTLTASQKRLTDGTKKTSSTYAFIANRITEYEEKVIKLKNEINDLNVASAKYANDIKKINQQTDPIIGASAEEPDKVRDIKKATAKELQQAINEQEKISIQEAELNGKRLLLFAQTEEEKAKIINATEQEIIAIRKAYSIQSLTAQAANQSKSVESYNQLKLDTIKAEEDGNARLQKARDKDTDNAVANSEYEAMLMQESLDGMLQMQDESYAILTGALAKEYNDGLVNLEKYNQNKLNAEIAYLKRRIQIYRSYGVFAGALQMQLANLEIKTTKDTATERNRILEQANRTIQNSFQTLFNDLATSFGEFLATTEMTENPLEKLFGGILGSIGGFMEALGKSIIAIGIAKLQLDTALATFNGPGAIAAGFALIAAGAATKAIAKQGIKAFADGGIVSGPTLGLVGEYPGASTNPEVIAPLDKLKSIIGGSDNSSGFIAETRISGRDLAIVLNRYNKDNARG